MGKKKEKTGQKGRLGIGFKMVMLTLLPVMSSIIALMLFSVSILNEGMEAEVIDGLKSLAYSARSAYNLVDEGEYYVESDNLFKGDHNITYDINLMDSFTEDSDVEITLFYGDTRYATSILDDAGKRILRTQASEKVVAEVINNGNTYQDTDLIINGTPFYAYYVPLEDDNGDVIGMVFAGRPQTSVREFIMSELTKLVVIGIVLLIVAIFVSAFFAMRMVKPINAVAGYMSEMGTGQLSIAIDKKILGRKDEIGDMVRAVQNLSGQLKEILAKIQADADALLNAGDQLSDMSEQTSSTANEIGKAVEDISKGAVSQADEVESATIEVENIGDMIQQIVKDAQNMDEVSDTMKQLGDKVATTIDDLTDTGEKTNQAVRDIAESVHMTDQFVEKIQEAVAVITSIASETSLLSLNASIEAARAGEAGRGFAVVASEIQNLADQSGKSALEIEKVIKELSDASAETVNKTDEVGVILEEQKSKLKETRQEFTQLETGINNTKDASNTILERTNVCNDSREKVMDVIQNLSAISEENAASSQETTASMEELNATINLVAEEAGQLHHLATDLQDALKFFKV